MVPRMRSWSVAFLMDGLASSGLVEASFGLFSFHSNSIFFVFAMTVSSSSRIFYWRAGVCSVIKSVRFLSCCMKDDHSPST